VTFAIEMIATTARSKPATPGMSLHEAIAKQSVSQVRVHINHGTVIDQEFIPEGYPFAGAGALHHAVILDNPEIVRMLLVAGADIAAPDGYGTTPSGAAMIPNVFMEDKDLKDQEAFKTKRISIQEYLVKKNAPLTLK
jgi:ankyrin repeat protein